MSFNFPKNVANLTKINASNGVEYTFTNGKWIATGMTQLSNSQSAPINHTHAIPEVINLPSEISRLEGLISTNSSSIKSRISALEGQVATINNTSTPNAPPTYTVSPGTASYNEGDLLGFTVTTTNVPNGTPLYWSVSNTSLSADLNKVSGTLTVSNNGCGDALTITADSLTEGAESFRILIYTDSNRTVLVANSGFITILDTSLAPSRYTYTVTNSGDIFNYIFRPQEIPGYQVGKTDAIFVNTNTGRVMSNTNASHALLVNDGWNAGDTVKIINNGLIIGKGGDAAGSDGYTVGKEHGGPALGLMFPTLLENNSIIGGGGGAGSSGCAGVYSAFA